MRGGAAAVLQIASQAQAVLADIDVSSVKTSVADVKESVNTSAKISKGIAELERKLDSKNLSRDASDKAQLELKTLEKKQRVETQHTVKTVADMKKTMTALTAAVKSRERSGATKVKKMMAEVSGMDSKEMCALIDKLLPKVRSIHAAKLRILDNTLGLVEPMKTFNAAGVDKIVELIDKIKAKDAATIVNVVALRKKLGEVVATTTGGGTHGGNLDGFNRYFYIHLKENERIIFVNLLINSTMSSIIYLLGVFVTSVSAVVIVGYGILAVRDRNRDKDSEDKDKDKDTQNKSSMTNSRLRSIVANMVIYWVEFLLYYYLNITFVHFV